MSWLTGQIRAAGGAVSFRDFMERALYDPEHGYYGAGRRPGRAGDFLTAPSASSWYALVLGRVTGRLARSGGGLTLVDVAAGDGALLAAILEDPPAGLVRVVGVERSRALREALGARLAAAGVGGMAVAELADAAPPEGPVLLHASELYDALPVHRVVGRAGGVMRELWVRADSDQLAWEERPAAPELERYLERHAVQLADGQVAELNLAAEPQHRSLLDWAGSRGVVVVLDYGYPAARLYDPRARRGGSLATFSAHRMGRDPFAAPGEQDLTAHVNWDDLRRAGAASGWVEIGLWPLAEFLIRSGLPALLESRGLGIEAELDAATITERQEIKRLLDPDGMGTDLKVLVQAAPKVAAGVEALFAM